MAKTKTLNKRRQSIRSIRKITRTMELISTACYRGAMERAMSAMAYTDRLTNMVRNLAGSGAEVSHPLLVGHPETKTVQLLVLSSNRGLCGGYNGGILRRANRRWNELTGNAADALDQKVENPLLDIAGKRGISYFNYRKTKPAQTFTQFEDRPAWDEVEKIADGYLEQYLTGKIDRLEIIYTKFFSMSKQAVVHETLLPLSELGSSDTAKDDTKSNLNAEYDFLPSAESILKEIVPASFKTQLFKCFLDAAVSEQIARMVAMKAATENADAMIQTLTMAVNRSRQSQITGELTELIGGVEALK
ncbi:MAG: ATP synthase F1 subunit gamma [Thermoguttaceae bacterium]|nr:ATP synthase F1 subunit gamma [Thermoguttaceae bacterium]